ncbi:MAG: hypothetical protein A2096_05075 [Spirochaetes bacterium GWF1_41_5]|nr:MAG: hypothetical protein A2096_05075 [Spirochaetes bacterium GWF1_41_5]HBE01541.1 hypothetical protein [Spirochaetia bacterium]
MKTDPVFHIFDIFSSEEFNTVWEKIFIRQHDDLIALNKKFSDLKLAVLYKEYLPDEKENRHIHQFIELAIVTKGHGRHEGSNQTFNIQTGDVVFINHHIIHRFIPMPDDELKVIFICFLPSIIESTATLSLPDKIFLDMMFFEPFFRNDKVFENKIHIADADFQRILAAGFHLVHYFSRLFAHPSERINELIKSFFFSLLHSVLLEYRRIIPHLSREYSTVQSILNFISENLYENITLDAVAVKTGLSKFYISAIFNRMIGYSIPDYINQKRIDKAKELLSGTNYSIIRIACEIGYNNISYFHRIFKSLTGSTPSDFRKKIIRN